MKPFLTLGNQVTCEMPGYFPAATYFRVPPTHVKVTVDLLSVSHQASSLSESPCTILTQSMSKEYKNNMHFVTIPGHMDC